MVGKSVEIARFVELGEKEPVKSSVREIFFESSVKKNFNDEIEKEKFFKRWTEIYFSNFPEQIFVASIDGNIVGYLTGCDQSEEFQKEFTEKVASYAVFSDLFDRFPAHLHINLSSQARGHGLGSKLIESYCQWLVSRNVKGLHIVTAPDARNTSFYTKNKFLFEEKREFNGNEFFFMGRELKI